MSNPNRGSEKYIGIQTNHITLAQFLKWAKVVQSGGEAKDLLSRGAVKVNDQTETRRGRKLIGGDKVNVAGKAFIVQSLVEEGADYEDSPPDPKMLSQL